LQTIADLKLKIPIQYKDSFVHTLMAANGEILSLQIDENDVTTNYNYAKEESINEKHKIDRAIAKVDFKELEYQTKYFTCTMHISANEIFKPVIMVNDESYEPSFAARLKQASHFGGKIFSYFILLFVYLWPFILLALVFWLIQKKYKVWGKK
jgi:hypothetical protein